MHKEYAIKIEGANEREKKSKRLYRTVKFLCSFFFLVILFFTVHSSVYAVTRYVNADSNGAANNPTRAFNDPNYTANDSYKTLSAAYTAASAGDIIELSGGTTGKSYPGHNGSIAKQLTIKGSSITGFNGTVTITNNYTSYTLGANADGIVLNNLTVSGSNAYVPLAIYKNNITVNNVILKDAGGNNYSLSLRTSTGYTTTFTNLVIYGNVNSRGIEFMNSNAGTANFYNCVVNGVANVGVYMQTGDTANFTNCVFTANGTVTPNMFYYNNGGTINTTNCLIQGTYLYPQTITGGSGSKTWNSANDIINGFPYYQATKANFGYIAFSTDDEINIDYCVTNANYAMTNYGIPITCFISDTQNLTASDKTKLQTLYKQGDEIGVHTRHHTSLAMTYPFKVTYSGSGTNMALVVSGNGTLLSVTGTADTHGPINLTSDLYDTVGELCTVIAGWSNYACTLSNNTAPSVLSNSLKDTSTTLSGATQIPYDDDTSANNRLYKEEITNAINDLETALHLDPDCSSYTVKTIAFPYNEANNAVLTWIKTHTNLIGARRNNSTTVISENVWLGSINLYNVYSGVLPGDFIGDGTQATIQKSARTLATYASNGYFIGMLAHSASEMTNQQWTWMLDELVKYKTTYHLNINSFANLINEIKTSGNWTDAGNGVWTRTFSGSDDFRLTPSSPMINAGTTVAGRTTDILGNPIVGNPDIGAYEFQAPSAPTSLAQYKSNGTTEISTGGWTNETSVVLKFNMSSNNVSDSLTPSVEIQPSGNNFTNSITNSGTTVAYSGSAVTGSVTVTGLVDGTIYHWQASATNSASISSWTVKGGSPDFGVDTSGPTTPGTPSITSLNGDNKPTWTWTTSTDASSGLAATPYTVQWCNNSSFIGCNSNVSTSTTNSFTHPTSLADGTWYFRVKATDTVGNNSSYSSNGTVVIDTTAPTISSITSTTLSGNYTVGQTINITVNFSENVTSTGNVTVTLNTTPSRTCTLTISAANTGSCTYTVKAGDTSAELEVLGISGTIKDEFLNTLTNFIPATALSTNKKIVIDTTAPTITSTTATNITNAEATITWTTGEMASSKVEYGLVNIYGYATAETDISTRVTSHSVILSSLAACTTYHYRVLSKDYALNETIDSDNTFTTTGCTGSDNINFQTSSQITTAAGGSLSLLSFNKGIILTVPVSFATSDANFQIKQLDKTAVTAVTSTPTGYSVIGPYIYDLKALIDISTSLSTFTNPITVSVVYDSSDISGIDETNMLLYRWDNNAWQRLTGCMVNLTTTTVSCTTTNFSIFGLFGKPPAANSGSPSSSFNSSSSSSSGGSSTSTPSCSDQSPGAKAPWLYGAIAQDSGSILLYFTEADDPVNKYVLKYGTKSGDYPYGSTNIGGKGTRTYLVQSLSPNTTYYFKVRGGNGCATGNWSNEISAKTKPNVAFNQLNLTSQLETVSAEKIQPTVTKVNRKKITTATPTPTDKKTKTQGSYNVKVKIVNSEKKPVKGATVTLHSTPQTTKTDKNGIAVFKNVEAGEHKILITYNNFEGEQSVNLTGDVKEFNITVTIQPKIFLLSPFTWTIIGTIAIIILLM